MRILVERQTHILQTGSLKRQKHCRKCTKKRTGLERLLKGFWEDFQISLEGFGKDFGKIFIDFEGFLMKTL